jgi:SCY1-like protein 1
VLKIQRINLYYRLVRDQASKTFDIFAQRVRKHAATLPETALRPSAAQDESASAGRPLAGSAQNGSSSKSSWGAGWVISSFTNKISAARGEMQAGVNTGTTTTTAAATSAAGGDGGGGSGGAQPTAATGPHHHRPPHGRPHPTSIRSMPADLRDDKLVQPEEPTPEIAGPASYFGDYDEGAGGDNDAEDAWGAMMEDGDDDDNNSKIKPEKEGGAEEKEKEEEKARVKQPVSAAFFDDSEEPDFGGWLAAQAAQAKAKHKPLPKGLAPKSQRPANTAAAAATAKPASFRRAATTAAITTTPTTTIAPIPRTKAQTVTAPSNGNDNAGRGGGGGGGDDGIDDDDDAWGDGWN